MALPLHFLHTGENYTVPQHTGVTTTAARWQDLTLHTAAFPGVSPRSSGHGAPRFGAQPLEAAFRGRGEEIERLNHTMHTWAQEQPATLAAP